MKRMTDSSQSPMKTCSLCNKSSQADGISLVYFGAWMTKKEITVHYYCLLLSSHLPQRGEDHSGILGFLLRDIRLEISMAKNRKCMYCFEGSASIQCSTCKKYYHLTCGHTSKCLSQFVGEFKSFCHNCIPIDQFKMELLSRNPSTTTELCFICAQMMGNNPKQWIYAKCCGNGFTHVKCMKMYALSAGYYLTCIWCKDKRFREDVKYLGVFVPDREANWEKEKGAYVELYRVHKRCDMEICNCPKGRDYTSALKWPLIICKFCGAFGAHNPSCIPGFECSQQKQLEFKCDICSVTEQTVLHKTNSGTAQDIINTSLYVSKDGSIETEPTILSQNLNNNNSFDATKSQEIKAVGKYGSTASIVNFETDTAKNTVIPSSVFTLTQSPQTSQQLEVSKSDSKLAQEEAYDSDDSVIADVLVKKLLDIFKVNV